jgi:hypothetical protein
VPLLHSLPTNPGEEPKEQAESDAEQDAGRQRKVKCGVLAFVDNVAWQSAQPKRELSAKIKKGANQCEQRRHNKQRPAEFAKWFHETKNVVAGL